MAQQSTSLHAAKFTAQELIRQMTLEEKASLCSGDSFWHTKAVKRLELPQIMMVDGPHGVRKQVAHLDHLGLFESEFATCFPTASGTANSFNPALLKEIGIALGEECLQESISVILGPGLNIKRSPLCGRNFEYFSEDPFLSGEMSAALIDGVQSQGVGTSAKHYAANNQEWCRMVSDSVVDERALREIYLTAFEKSVKQSNPWTVMCSYNKINGTYASENKWLLTEVLRDEWGFKGLVVSDWGAVVSRIKGVEAGMDLEMPSNSGVNDAMIIEAVKNGSLKEEALDKIVIRILDLILISLKNTRKDFRYDADAHQALAKKAAIQSSVLLKNENSILPLKEKQSLAVIGAFAKEPRYQGAGSSRINPSRMETIFDSLKAAGIDFDYADGYSLTPFSPADENKIAKAVETAKGKDAVVIVTGLPAEYESEGFDRPDLTMSDSHQKLIDAVCAVNPNVVAVLQLGAPVEIPWADKVRAIMVAYLGGQAGGAACVDLLLGKASPSGKLAETWPKALSDTPCYNYFPGGTKSVQYRESIFVGYRYYDTVDKEAAYPFGYGLSYTTFEYKDLEINDNAASFTLTNTGKTAGTEISQLYTGLADSQIFRAAKELKGFIRTELLPGESKRVSIPLDSGTTGTTRSFAYYNTAIKNWAVEGGEYTIYIGASSRDIRLTGSIKITGDGHEQKLLKQKETVSVYFSLPKDTPEIPEAQFAALCEKPMPAMDYVPAGPFTIENTMSDLQTTSSGKWIAGKIMKIMGKHSEGIEDDGGQILKAMMLHSPLRMFVNMSNGKFSRKMAEGIIDIANGRLIRGIIKLITNIPKGG